MMHGARARVVALFAVSLAIAHPTPPAHAQPDSSASPRASAPLTLLQINDVYSTVPVDNLGGLARVATLKKQVAAEGGTPLLVLAGDFLSSSVASTVFKGEQMIAALNAAGLDMATLGNHEFDFGVDLLVERMAEAKWQWVVSNVIDRATGRPIGGAAPYVVRTFGAIKVGFIGLCLTSGPIRADMLERVRLIPPVEAAATYVPIVRREGADAIVALTHLTFQEDRELAERFPDIDVIVGGHEHFPIAAAENRTFISKAGTDAKWVARIDLKPRGPRLVERFYELIPITADLPDDLATAKVVHDYESRLGPELDAVVGVTRIAIDAVTERLRSSETNAGNLVADAMRASVKADMALLNAGGIRGDRLHAPGPLTRRALLEMQPFGNVVCVVQVSGATVLRALERGVSRLPDVAGQFPQVSGLSFRVDARAPAGSRVSDVVAGGAPLDPRRLYTLAIPDFILQGGDNYDMFGDARVLVGPEDGDLIATALERYVASSGAVAPAIEGRIVIQR